MNGFFPTSVKEIIRVKKEFKIDTSECDAENKFFYAFNNFLEKLWDHNSRPIVIVCIGTDRSTGDAFGPIVGSELTACNIPNLNIYGNLDSPVHAANLTKTLNIIKNKYQNPFILAVDACLGRMDHIGYVNIGEGSLRPGAGVKKNLPPVGEMYITGVVNVGGFMEHLVLQNTRLGLVMNMAKIVSKGAARSLRILMKN
ncbi:MAG: hypothetical protein PWQ82_317 [Thermosediminibacterales bacterium]|nr:hypothetical protein [Thermosediminibacterales bacterium]MDK2836401.1 hypothetical protein [Thermosediminibacterales bacterium]